MNEETIKQKLAEHLEKNKVVPEDPGLIKVEQERPEPVEAFHNDLPLDNMILQGQVMDLLGIPALGRKSSDIRDQVDTIIRWAAASTGKSDLANILEIIGEQQRFMGIQHKEDKVNRLYRYIKLNNQRSAADAQMKALYG